MLRQQYCIVPWKWCARCALYPYMRTWWPSYIRKWVSCKWWEDGLLCASLKQLVYLGTGRGMKNILTMKTIHPKTPILGSQVFFWKVTSNSWAVWGGHLSKYHHQPLHCTSARQLIVYSSQARAHGQLECMDIPTELKTQCPKLQLTKLNPVVKY